MGSSYSIMRVSNQSHNLFTKKLQQKIHPVWLDTRMDNWLRTPFQGETFNTTLSHCEQHCLDCLPQTSEIYKETATTDDYSSSPLSVDDASGIWPPLASFFVSFSYNISTSLSSILVQYLNDGTTSSTVLTILNSTPNSGTNVPPQIRIRYRAYAHHLDLTSLLIHFMDTTLPFSLVFIRLYVVLLTHKRSRYVSSPPHKGFILTCRNTLSLYQCLFIHSIFRYTSTK